MVVLLVIHNSAWLYCDKRKKGNLPQSSVYKGGCRLVFS
ncbi:hypothetical protein PU02_0242 [Bartonella ancashensis]|uniref:Uncharacterized protein n=1 Tax=Bartonella ancashensis TaxID=1318743 RepID=A0A0M4LHM9_9HYPH|nr:hypothetical protein PU02_0242 [Bartonella ancashensis]